MLDGRSAAGVELGPFQVPGSAERAVMDVLIVILLILILLSLN